MKNTFAKVVVTSLLSTVALVMGIGLIPSRAASTAASVPTGIPPVEQPAVSTPAGPLSPNQDRVEVELVTVSAAGFEPSEITRPAGRFLLGVNNRTRSEELSFQLVHESGSSVESTRMSGKKTWRKMMDLPAGRYVLQATGYPDHVCRITILPR